MRLNKFLSNNGVASRRKCDELIFNGKVKINGVVIKEPWYEVKSKDKIEIDNKLLEINKSKENIVILFYKPAFCIVSRNDPEGRKTIYDYLPEFNRNEFFYVGRLDFDTEGIILLTNDGGLANKLMHPRYGIEKTYVAKLEKPLTEKDIMKINEGIEIEGEKLELIKFRVLKNDKKNTEVMLIIQEGRNRIVKKLFETLGNNVKKLKRTVFHKYDLKGLNPGEYRLLKKQEIIDLYKFFQGR